MYLRQYDIRQEHVDVHEIVDGLYYPFYFEWCRHSFAAEVLGFDVAARAKAGVNMVLVEQQIKFKKSLRYPGIVDVSCRAQSDGARGLTLLFIQEIRNEGGVCATGTFTATCTSAESRRPFIPQDVLDKVAAQQVDEQADR